MSMPKVKYDIYMCVYGEHPVAHTFGPQLLAKIYIETGNDSIHAEGIVEMLTAGIYMVPDIIRLKQSIKHLYDDQEPSIVFMKEAWK